MTRIDLEQLVTEIRAMQRHQPLYKVLRDELTKLGFWKARPRGNTMPGKKKGQPPDKRYKCL